MPEPEVRTPDCQTFFLLEKYDPFQGICTGIATGQQVDRDQEILDYAKSKPFFEAWSDSVKKDSDGHSLGNVRLQHDEKKPVGKLTAMEFNDEAKLIRVSAKIVEPVAKDMLEQRVLTGFSIGGRYISKTPQTDGTTLYVADPCEISVVDRPAYPDAVFQQVKADGSIELRKFAKYEEPKRIADEEHRIVGEHRDEASPELQDHVDEEKCSCKCAECAAGSHAKCTSQMKCKAAKVDHAATNKAVRYLVPDGEHLPYTDESGNISHHLMGAAWAALHGGYRGNKYEGPDKAKAIAQLTRLYESEGMETPGASKTIGELLEMLKAGDIQSSIEQVNELLEELEKVTMPDDKKEETLTLDKAARHSIHQKIAAAKAHLTDHLDKCTKAVSMAHGHLDGIAKVMGGGPEVMDEGGKPDSVEHPNPKVTPQPAGGSDMADKGFKYVDAGNGLFKRVPINPEPLTEEGVARIVLQTLIGTQKAANAAIGDRTKVVPFVKAATKEGDGGAASGEGAQETMSKEDWKAYGQGNRDAIAKAQRLTGQKWQAVPSRILNRAAQNAGAMR